ncbi:MAG: carboxypeptidase-like regulatory domain-containing protein [Gemmataceae bacterium]
MRRAGGIAIVLVAFTGCGDSDHAGFNHESDLRPALLVASRFDAATSGTITGQVRWNGAIPNIPPIAVERFNADGTKIEHVKRPNQHAPKIDADGHFANAVLYLRRIDCTRAKPWDHPPVTIEMHDEQPMVRQGNGPRGLVGFVHRGDAITLVSKQPLFHALRARGAHFFTLMLPDPDKPRRRVLIDGGHVELSSGSGQAAMRGHLFVDDHPYYALTNSEGRFSLTEVPAGNYELICWYPDWRIDRWEHDPETMLHVRLYFKPPVEIALSVHVKHGETSNVVVELQN